MEIQQTDELRIYFLVLQKVVDFLRNFNILLQYISIYFNISIYTDYETQEDKMGFCLNETKY